MPHLILNTQNTSEQTKSCKSNDKPGALEINIFGSEVFS